MCTFASMHLTARVSVPNLNDSGVVVLACLARIVSNAPLCFPTGSGLEDWEGLKGGLGTGRREEGARKGDGVDRPCTEEDEEEPSEHGSSFLGEPWTVSWMAHVSPWIGVAFQQSKWMGP